MWNRVRRIAKSLIPLTLAGISINLYSQTASYHDHNIYHGAGTAYINTSPQAQNVGSGGVLRAQLIWQVSPGQSIGADLDLHAKLPGSSGPYTVTYFDPVGALPGTPQKTPPFGNPNTSPDGNQQVNWVNRTVVFSNGQSIAALDQDNRTGIPNTPSGALVENIYIGGANPAYPNNVPSGTYQFAVHNYNQTHLADPQAAYEVRITTNGMVGVRSEGHYLGTGNDPSFPGIPVYSGSLTSEGQSSPIYSVDIVNPGHDPHAPGITVVDRKKIYVAAYRAELARLAEQRRQQAMLYHQQIDSYKQGQQFCTNGYASVPCSTPGAVAFDATKHARPYEQKITITNYKDEWNLFGTLRVIDNEYTVIAKSRDEARRLLSLEAEKHREASIASGNAIYRGEATFSAVDVASNFPVLGQGLSLGSAISGISTSGDNIGAWERLFVLTDVYPGTKQAKRVGTALDAVGDIAKKSPDIKPMDVANKTPQQIDIFAKEQGLISKGTPANGEGAYIDPVTGKQRILIHPNGCSGPHCHVNDPSGQRLDINGHVVMPEAKEAHLPLKQPQNETNP